MKDLLKKLLRNTAIASIVIGAASLGVLLIIFVVYLIAEAGMWYLAIPVAAIGAGLWYTGVELAAEKWGR